MPGINRFTLPAAGLLLLATGLVACGGGDSAGPGHRRDHSAMTMTPSTAPAAGGGSADSGFNDTDVSFATGMIPHHAQAIQMADLAADRATDTEVKHLAAAIRAAQDPEIATMSGWLTTWGKPVPPAAGEHAGHDGGGSMPGMMSTQAMDQLKGATGAAFDRMWLTMMIEHHQGAITMATQETDTGSYQPAITLARSIIARQGQEIATMQQALTRLG
jgi:uncharacterized protein (DUF305 family)